VHEWYISRENIIITLINLKLKNGRKNIKIEVFSKHLLGDVERTKLDFKKHERYIVQQVLEYGLINDWKLLSNYYGIMKIAKVATKIRDLEPKSLSFISLLSKIPKEKFLCYTTKQLIPPQWNF